MTKYTENHEYVDINDNIATIGLTEKALEDIGDVMAVNLPEINNTINKGEKLFSLESAKAAVEIKAPISGEIIEINENVEDEPELINNSPYEEGWICKIKITKPEEINTLKDAD